jgi:hypothetical protein
LKTTGFKSALLKKRQDFLLHLIVSFAEALTRSFDVSDITVVSFCMTTFYQTLSPTKHIRIPIKQHSIKITKTSLHRAHTFQSSLSRVTFNEYLIRILILDGTGCLNIFQYAAGELNYCSFHDMTVGQLRLPSDLPSIRSIDTERHCRNSDSELQSYVYFYCVL